MCLNCQLYSEVTSSFTLVKSAKKVKRYKCRGPSFARYDSKKGSLNFRDYVYYVLEKKIYNSSVYSTYLPLWELDTSSISLSS